MAHEVSPPRDTPASDEALMARVQQDDDAQAFAMLVARYQGPVRRFCATYLACHDRARDVAQETFVAVWEARARYRAQGAFRAFLFTVARNTSLSAHRKARFLSLFTNDESDMPDPSDGAVDSLDAAQGRAAVRSALRRVPLRFREPLMLRFVENMSYDEIARIIGRTPSAARSRIFYGLRALAKQLPSED